MELTWTSIADWLVRAGLGGSLLIVCTLLAMRWVRQPARRQRLGELGMAAALIVAALCWGPAWLPLWAPAAPASDMALEVVLTPVNQPGGDDLLEPLAFAPEAALAPAGETAPAPIQWTDWLLPAAVTAYGLGALFYLARWLTGVVVLWRIVRAAQPATSELLADLHARCASRRRPRLLISTRLQVPASCGVFQPTLILPASLADAEHAAERDWVFDHELTHLARRDAWSAVLFALGQMLYFVLPWFWWLKRMVRLCQEYVADAAACRRRPADEYAEFLLSLTNAPAAPLAATGVTGPSSDLYRRVAMLLQNPVRVELTCPRVWTVGAAGVLLGLAVIAAGVGPAQAQPPNQKEVLEQLERIQDMVNKLRHQLADQPRDVLKLNVKPHVIVVDTEDPKVEIELFHKKDDAQARAAKRAADETVRKAFLYLQKTQVDQADQQRAHAQLERAKADLQLRLAQIEKENKSADPKKVTDNQKSAQAELERYAAERDRALAEYQRALAATQLQRVQVQLNTDKELNTTLEALQKHLAELKDSETKKAVQDAVNRLKDMMKKQPGAIAVPPMPSVPAHIRTIPVPATPKAPAYPVPPKPGVVVTAPRATPDATVAELRNVYDYVAPNTALATPDGGVVLWTTKSAQPQTGRLGIRVDAPGAILADQLNLPKDQGLVIAEVFDKSVAQKAGIKVNDILLKINQQSVSSDPQLLIKQVADIKADAPFDIVVLRRGKQETIQNVRLPEPPQPARVYAYRALGSLVDSKNVKVTITAKHTGNTITLHRNEGALGITVSAEVADGKSKVTGIAIVEKDKTNKYGNVQEVPEPNRAKVQHLLQLLDSVNLPAPAPAVPDRKGPASKKASPSGDIDLYYRIPENVKPKVGADLKIELPVQELPQRSTLNLTVPNVNVEPGTPARFSVNVPKSADSKQPLPNP